MAARNARDQHMMTTILRLRASSRQLFGLSEKELKIIVWAHNSHVGDATATPMGGTDFQRNEPLGVPASKVLPLRKWNLGQLLGTSSA